MLITPAMMMQVLPQLVPQLSQVTGMLIGGKKGRDIATRGALLGQVLGLADLGKSFLSPSMGKGLKIAGGKLGDLGESTGMINPKGFGAFDGALKEGATFGQGINKLPESIGGNFKSPSWNAPESLFNPPGETKPFDWSLFR